MSMKTAILIVVHVEGSHFIWKMVRRLVGILVEVGRGGLSPSEAVAMLTSRSSSRRDSRRQHQDCFSSACTTKTIGATCRCSRVSYCHV